MIHKLKWKLTAVAALVMLLLMAMLVGMMNILNYRSVIRDSDAMLEVLSRPSLQPGGMDAPPKKPEDWKDIVPHGMSPEEPLEARYFVVLLKEDGEVLEKDLSRIVSVDEISAQNYIRKAQESTRTNGFVGQFRFRKTADGKGSRIVFLDCGRKLEAFRTYLWISIAVGLFGCVLGFFLVLSASGRIVRPMAESYEKQKRFISDAGHEIRTPLTVIRANLDLLETEGEREELTDIRRETDRLTQLTRNLVLLSKMEESGTVQQKICFPLSDVLFETANSFRVLAVPKNLRYCIDITPGIAVNGNPDAVRQIASILLDNAFKYTPDGGEISVILQEQKRAVQFAVKNTVQGTVSEKELSRVFDRFYRMDASRSAETGGHGIGLSIAKVLAESGGGTIAAHTEGGKNFIVTVTLPREG